MDGPKMLDSAKILLRLLPAEILDRVLASLEPKDAERLRSMRAEAVAPVAADEQSRALSAFFDMMRIADRTVPQSSPYPTEAKTSNPKTPAAVADEAAPDPVQAVKGIEPALLARAVDDEPPGVVATLISRLEPQHAADLLRKLPAARRMEVAIRLNQGTTQSPELVERLARATIAKANRIAAIPPEPTPDDRVRGLVALLRRLDRPDRVEILQAIEEKDPQSATAIRQQMFSFTDLTRVEDRALQNLLTEFDAKTLATALKGAPADVAEKILRNTSSRNRQMLTDEISLLGTIPQAAMDAAQDRIAELLRRYEEEGKITIDS
jgi:flagellar motor switch protein FliG